MSKFPPAFAVCLIAVLIADAAIAQFGEPGASSSGAIVNPAEEDGRGAGLEQQMMTGMRMRPVTP